MRLDDPHSLQTLAAAGPAPEEAEATMVLFHGRGATAESILSLYWALELPSFAALAPQAAGLTWYPQSFLAPLEANQPYLGSALRIGSLLIEDLLQRKIRSDRIALLGFSQGACLALEVAARNPRRYGAVIGLSGGLIGPPGTAFDYSGSLAGTPVFLGASDPDPHVPFARVDETREVLTRIGAAVEARRYPGLPHTVNEDEIRATRSLLTTMVAGAQS